MKHYLTYILMLIGIINANPALAAFPVSAPQQQKTIHYCPPDDETSQQKSGIFGKLSLYCSLVPILSPLAIAFGIIGLGKNRKNRGSAQAGLIVGAGWFVLMGIILLMIGK